MNQIEVSPGGVQALSNNLQNLSSEVSSAEESMAIVVNGDTAPKAISKGQYLFIKNHSTLATGGYHATAAISSGQSVAGSVAADSEGICNALNSKITQYGSCVLLNAVGTLEELGSQLLTLIRTLTDGEQIPVRFGVKSTYDTSVFEWLDYTGFVTRLNNNQFAAEFINNRSRTLTVSTTNGGTSYDYSRITSQSVFEGRGKIMTDESGVFEAYGAYTVTLFPDKRLRVDVFCKIKTTTTSDTYCGIDVSIIENLIGKTVQARSGGTCIFIKADGTLNMDKMAQGGSWMYSGSPHTGRWFPARIYSDGTRGRWGPNSFSDGDMFYGFAFGEWT